MCACSESFTCSKCAGTPYDLRYEEDAYEPMSEQEFDKLSAEPVGGRDWAGWV